MKTSPIVKICGCGRSYTLQQWRRLRFVGVLELDGETFSEMRDCAACHSTICLGCRLVACPLAATPEARP
jgi:hypothetical protein